MGLIDKTTILAALDLKSTEIEVPEWGGSVRLREMSGAAITQFWESCRDEKGNVIRTVVQSNLLKLSLVDEHDQPLFGDDDIAALMAKNAAVLAKLFDAAQKLNGMGDPKAAEKNSEAATIGG
jgi:hypothetical protein